MQARIEWEEANPNLARRHLHCADTGPVNRFNPLLGNITKQLSPLELLGNPLETIVS
ncbi:hypothetical protein HNO89_001187 [Sporosarcina luteola]|nr:hypothetical protein [Sporosarcina luteola]